MLRAVQKRQAGSLGIPGMYAHVVAAAAAIHAKPAARNEGPRGGPVLPDGPDGGVHPRPRRQQA